MASSGEKSLAASHISGFQIDSRMIIADFLRQLNIPYVKICLKRMENEPMMSQTSFFIRWTCPTYEYIKERADKLRLLTSSSALRLSVWLFDDCN